MRDAHGEQSKRAIINRQTERTKNCHWTLLFFLIHMSGEQSKNIFFKTFQPESISLNP